ncbi:hypothetical protein ATCV1_z346R [Acanthocystis turfacea chlorella virus 1]|uniref:Uncharacterized protein z346R n=1 Tax=Chlorovirus heliozoae TaxID=322019 RepID=A7K8V6_9PHYC|nr:hypothetical protein ATCV1_z346R [Acanthocystis turfacea chlorella virus 1]ABT16480.1 hypothetical protein ATCV1_z346R [Acanthocystis turfacea chlorella virus 1]
MYQTINPLKILHVICNNFQVKKQCEQTFKGSRHVPVVIFQESHEVGQHLLGKVHHAAVVGLGDHKGVEQREGQDLQSFHVFNRDLEEVGI